ncbi:hypothetical protein MFLAVUS_006712 [Mucor flavus]|uniref:NOT2/NOT3/NOT5 C-terminal domain-containing protein n=1 Tax=Mucor flavus TaxID=439312 RepID=A0ABP9Z2A9_9FUNG
MFHQNIGVDDMDEFPALGTPSNNNNQIMQRTYASTVQDPAYHRAQSYDTPSPHFTRHDLSALTQFEPRHGVHENTNTTTPKPSHVGPWGQGRMRINETSSQVKVHPSTKPNTPSTTQNSVQQDSYSLSDLTGILRGTDPDRTMMAIGDNLSMLRLNLNSPHPLYSYFLSPWSDTQKLPGFAVEPGYYVPACYREAKASPPAHERLSSYSEEALFYMFYSMANDVTQMESAKEL